MKHRLPNVLTYSRIAIIPLIAIVFYIPGDWGRWLAAGLFVLAGFTDFLDGYLARMWQVQSSIGRMLDPIADKLLVATALLLLVSAGRADLLPAAAIVCREILVSGLREFLASLQISVPVSQLGKVKTAVQMLAITLLLFGDVHMQSDWITFSGNILLWLAAVFTLITGYAYLRTGIAYLK